METIRHQITIEAPAKEIYALIATKTGIQKWLREEDSWKITGEEQLGGVLDFYFGESHHAMKVAALEPYKKVSWKCTDGPPEWLGTSVNFAIEARGDECTLDFEHAGWAAHTPFFDQCDHAWDGYVSDIKEQAEG